MRAVLMLKALFCGYRDYIGSKHRQRCLYFEVVIRLLNFIRLTTGRSVRKLNRLTRHHGGCDGCSPTDGGKRRDVTLLWEDARSRCSFRWHEVYRGRHSW